MYEQGPILAAERLARLILPHSTMEPRAPGDNNRVTAADAACSMAGWNRDGTAGLTEIQSLLVRVVHLGDMSVFGELERQTWQLVVSEIVVPLNWHAQIHVTRHWYWRRMAQLALCELVFPATCPACRGRRAVYADGARPMLEPCPLCVGHTPRRGHMRYHPARPRRRGLAPSPLGAPGRFSYSTRRRAALVGMRPSSWQTWEPRYLQHVKPIPARLLNDAECHIGERLKRA